MMWYVHYARPCEWAIAMETIAYLIKEKHVSKNLIGNLFYSYQRLTMLLYEHRVTFWTLKKIHWFKISAREI